MSVAACCGRTHRNGHAWNEIRDNLIARIAEAERQGWLGEVEGLQVSLAGANDKLAQIDQITARRSTAVQLGIPSLHRRRRTHHHRHDRATLPKPSMTPERQGNTRNSRIF